MKSASIIFLLINISFHSQAQYIFDQAKYDSLLIHKFKNSSRVIDYLPKGFVEDGSVDYTDFLLEAIKNDSCLIFPDFPLLIQVSKVRIKSNTSWLFNKNSQLIAVPNDRSAYRLLTIDSVSDVELFNLVLIGDRDEHFSSVGQWGNGLSIKRADNIKIIGLRADSFFGDGIYIGSDSKNIYLKNISLDRNRRNGISIISAVNLVLENILVSNTGGHNPQSGIDIEPNNHSDRLVNIKLINVVTKNSVNHGLIISLGNLASSKINEIDISVIGHQDYHSKIALGISLSRSKPGPYENIRGNISLEKLTYFDNPIFIKNYTRFPHKVIFDVGTLNFLKRSDNVNMSLASEVSDILNRTGRDKMEIK